MDVEEREWSRRVSAWRELLRADWERARARGGPGALFGADLAARGEWRDATGTQEELLRLSEEGLGRAPERQRMLAALPRLRLVALLTDEEMVWLRRLDADAVAAPRRGRA